MKIAGPRKSKVNLELAHIINSTPSDAPCLNKSDGSQSPDERGIQAGEWTLGSLCVTSFSGSLIHEYRNLIAKDLMLEEPVDGMQGENFCRSSDLGFPSLALLANMMLTAIQNGPGAKDSSNFLRRLEGKTLITDTLVDSMTINSYNSLRIYSSSLILDVKDISINECAWESNKTVRENFYGDLLGLKPRKFVSIAEHYRSAVKVILPETINQFKRIVPLLSVPNRGTSNLENLTLHLDKNSVEARGYCIGVRA